MEIINNSAPRRYPWLSVLVGIIFVAVGVWCIFTPMSTFAALTILFIAGFLATGVFDIASALMNTSRHNWGWLLVTGIVNLLIGIWLWAMPASEAARVLVYFLGFYVFFFSAMGIVASIEMRKFVRSWRWMLAFAIIGLICSFFFIMSPVFGAVYLSWMVGLSFISYGFFRCLYF